MLVGMAAVGLFCLLVPVQAALDAYKVFLNATFTDELVKSCVAGLSGGLVISIPMVLCIGVMGCLDRRYGAKCQACSRTVTGAGLLQILNEQGECFHCKARVLTS